MFHVLVFKTCMCNSKSQSMCVLSWKLKVAIVPNDKTQTRTTGTSLISDGAHRRLSTRQYRVNTTLIVDMRAVWSWREKADL